MFDSLVSALLKNGARCATRYVSDREVIRATRVCFGGKLPRKGANLEVVLSHGRPNYAEREFIRKCKLAGEPFPVKKVQLKFPKAKPVVAW